MKKTIITTLLLTTLPFMLASCSALPSAFSTENIMKIHQGMSSDEILTLFGKPKSIRMDVCGKEPDLWNCTTWYYGESPYDHASFRFSGEHDSLILNNFEINRDYNEWN
jgi:hypothetical protein